ncbi:ImmA/IrrE family metallo-endopeptidase [bacterium]|nr:ImmA/IrrE family metallo-endopeptidase [bacterium]
MTSINPNILIWARETAGLSYDQAAKGIFSDSKNKSGIEKLKEIENGLSHPTRSQLIKLSKKYRRSLLVFYLDRPPLKGDRGEDFRTLPTDKKEEYAPTLDALIRDVRVRQNLIHSIIEEDEFSPLNFVNSIRINDNIEFVSEKITEYLRFDIQVFRKQPNIEESFKYLRNRIESTGIFILLIGNLGSHHTNIPVEHFRGFAISDPIAPFIIINDQDAKSAWSFTVLHELVHIWLGVTGISDPYANSQIERFCNKVASNILLNNKDLSLLSDIGLLPLNDQINKITSFANSRKLSRAMVAYRLHLSKKINKDSWASLSQQFQREWIESQKLKKNNNNNNDNNSDGPSYYIVRRHRLGASLLNLVNRALSEGTITFTKAGKIFGVKPRNVEPLLHGLTQQG